jgi:DNA-binding NarL/FixJ family response regulator
MGAPIHPSTGQRSSPLSRSDTQAGAGATPATRESDSPRPVTDRQLEILVNVARGKTNREIGESLGISERTVRNHMRSILQRLSSSDRTHAVVVAIGHGWIAVPIEPEGDGIGEAMPELTIRTA